MNRRLVTIIAVAFVAYLFNTAYIAAVAAATLVYVTAVLAHVVGGAILAGLLVFVLLRFPEVRRNLLSASLVLLLGGVVGGYLVLRGNTSDQYRVLAAHIAVSGLGVIVIGAAAWRAALSARGGWRRFAAALSLATVALLGLPAATAVVQRVKPNPSDRIRNPTIVPASMQHEGGGPASPFFPSSARTNVGGTIPSSFFMDSEKCAECHREIYDQWKGSMHHFASFNNQFYRKSIEYMQEVVGTQPTKWCAGCHDHAVFFNGRFDRPIKEQIDTPEAHTGLGCLSCHSIVHVDSSMGNGGFTIEYPPLHELASSKNRVVRTVSRFFTYLDPQPHRRSFMKPFMREDSAEFCSTCHKVHLDVPVNKYRWMRGFNEYDSWQASGVSGQGARSFYYPAASSTCIGCHMPLVPSKEPGNHGGRVHSHDFAAANTAVPFVNEDEKQLAATERFLKSGFISVDIFAITPAMTGSATRMLRRTGDGPSAMTTFATGEEADQNAPAVIRDVSNVAAPLDRAAPTLAPGDTVRVDVVVRTRKIGHFFPGGTVDAFDVWLELQGHDAEGRVVFWSGNVEDEGRGAVDPSAHFYRSYLLDAQGHPINKRNAWQARSILYTRLIPPGAADVAHFRVRVPDGAKGPLTFTARLNYRKFSHYYTQFAYAGQPKPGQPGDLVSASFNALEYAFAPENVPANVSGRLKATIPDLPIVTLATATATIPLGNGTSFRKWAPRLAPDDRERWNDWGIGLLLQGDLKGAEYAFRQVTEIDPAYADGWLNVARALVQEGETAAAKPFIERAVRIDASLGRVHYFRALVQKADGDYDGAVASLRTVTRQFPRDRVALNQLARVLFLQRRFREALDVLGRICLIDPEDVQMHYSMMLCYRALGDREQADREEALFRRFKADEASQAVTAIRRRVSPEDNNERQAIHDHESVALGGGVR